MTTRKVKTVFSRQLGVWAVALGLGFPAACGTSSGVVGGRCAPGHLDCDGLCVDSRHDRSNCGACSYGCQEDEVCLNGVCGIEPDGDAGASGNDGIAGTGADSGASGAPGSAASSGTGGSGAVSGMASGGSSGGGVSGNIGGSGEGGSTDGGEAGSGGEAGAGRTCVAPYDSPLACGDCQTHCVDPTPNCSPDGVGNYHCVVTCMDPLKECNGKCVDYNVDPNNCGSCGRVCASAICQGGTCVGAYDGHVVLACMSYQSPVPASAQTVLMGNAVFLRMRDPVRILAYTEFASPATRTNVNLDITYAATARKMGYSISQLDKYTDVTAKLNIANYDVFLIYDQNTAPTGELSMVGAAWQASGVLDSFVAAGGVIIGLSGGVGEMDQFFDSSGLLSMTGQTPIVTDSKLYKVPSGDVIGTNVISPFAAPAESCRFTTTVTPDSTTAFVIEDAPGGTGAPVVVHHTIAAP